jgi:hypothetical protein
LGSLIGDGQFDAPLLREFANEAPEYIHVASTFDQPRPPYYRRVSDTKQGVTVAPEYDELRPLSIDLDGRTFAGTYRVMTGSVIVYRGSEVKFASYGRDRPELIAQWLLKDLCRRELSKERKHAAR